MRVAVLRRDGCAVPGAVHPAKRAEIARAVSAADDVTLSLTVSPPVSSLPGAPGGLGR
jgi:hypothetical protein